LALPIRLGYPLNAPRQFATPHYGILIHTKTGAKHIILLFLAVNSSHDTYADDAHIIMANVSQVNWDLCSNSIRDMLDALADTSMLCVQDVILMNVADAKDAHKPVELYPRRYATM
jgi:hypothetical protein